MIESNHGQNPLSGIIYAWIILLVLCWAGNSVIIKVIVNDIPPFWSAFFRFAMAYPFLAVFIFLNKVKLTINFKEFSQILFLALLTFIQISLFNVGAKFTSGGRITLFIFSYPLMVPILAHFVIKEEKLKKNTIIGSLIAFIGLFLPLHNSIILGGSNLLGDVTELASCISLVFLIVFTKKVISIINKWKVIFWQMLIAISLFFITAFLFENININTIKTGTFYSIIFQSLVINTFCFLSFQYLLSRHNSSQISIFFFATPLLGMLMGVVLLKEKFEWIVLAGCIFVGVGIYIANSKWVKKAELKNSG